ncbi:MAG: cytochrome c [Myxococcota bacterium]
MRAPAKRAFCALLALALAASFAGCEEVVPDEPAAATPVESAQPSEDQRRARERGRALVERFQCNRCHTIDEVAEPAPSQNCLGCHRAIEAGTFEASEDDLERWRSHITNLVAAPSLLSVGARLRPAWITAFLLEPKDLRPALGASMPRLPMSEDEAQDIAAFLTRDAGAFEAIPERALVAAGRRAFERLACGACHVFRDAEIPEQAQPEGDDGARLAPDLAHVRERFVSGRLAEWIANPSAMKHDTLMPSAASAEQARALAAYLWHAPLRPVRQTPPPLLPILERRVSYEEVNEHIFHRTCRHCHADADLAFGDGGPGNDGGFGFERRGLNLTNYEGASAGVLVDGRRTSIYAPDASGMPRLVHALRARQLEEVGERDPTITGMPLAHPAVSPEDLQLVRTWVAQGRLRF